jgi:hypothetical protein
MRYAKRMLLIPEDVYQSLMSIQPTTAKGIKTPLKHVLERVERLGDSNTAMNEDERLVHYQQEFKRYSKLLRDERERPVNVQVDNLRGATESVVNALKNIKGKRRRRPANVPSSSHVGSSSSPSSSPTGDDHSTATHFSSANENNNNNSDVLSNEEEKEEAKVKDDDEEIPQASQNDVARKEAALNYVHKYPGRLNVNEQMGVVRLMQGEYRAIKESNADRLLEYHFSPKRNERKKPPGYATFLNAAKGDPKMSQLLFGDQSSSSSRRKQGGGKRDKKKNKSLKSITSFRFTPKLW